ncbi:transcription elongation factor SPT6 [Caerostris extrusa]|uniref:Transcription elongation factor SPT6 n=1 Tax=Caerostris extrusa TaxID=172846 RepID=A0AAV4P3P8_CAEEX|nr:transcription elongation factor SPT6 [Caerostris extrusa]
MLELPKIDIERFATDLTSRSSDLADRNNEWRPPKDQYFDYESEEKDMRVYLKRVIVHPSFKNVGFPRGRKTAQNNGSGDVIIRPSSKPFEDLDEIIARHIQPMAGYARDLLNFRYYTAANGGKREEVEKVLYEEKKKAPSKIHYYISASKQYPGKFMLSYLPRNKVKHEFITCAPNGLKYRGKMFRSVNSLLRWFKEHFRDPIPGTPSMSIHTQWVSLLILALLLASILQLWILKLFKEPLPICQVMFSMLYPKWAVKLLLLFKVLPLLLVLVVAFCLWSAMHSNTDFSYPCSNYPNISCNSNSCSLPGTYSEVLANTTAKLAKCNSNTFRSTPKSSGVTTQDWKRMAEQWAKKSQRKHESKSRKSKVTHPSIPKPNGQRSHTS